MPGKKTRKTLTGRRGAQTIGAEIATLTRGMFSRHGFSEADIVLRWPEIVGSDLARISSPERLSRRRGPGQSAARVLTIRVAEAGALEVQYMAGQIIERINSFYGYELADRIKIVQGVLPAAPEPSQTNRPANLSAQAQARLATSLESLPPGPLAQALERLGKAVMGDRPKPPPKSPLNGR